MDKVEKNLENLRSVHCGLPDGLSRIDFFNNFYITQSYYPGVMNMLNNIILNRCTKDEQHKSTFKEYFKNYETFSLVY